MPSFLLSHDLGTSGDKASLFSVDGKLAGSLVSAYPTYHPRDGWVEQDAGDWWSAVCVSTRRLLARAGVDPADVAGISFSGHMQGCLLVDGSGIPLIRSLIWADTRSGEQEGLMKRVIGADAGYAMTGNRLSASYTAAKLLWLRQNEPEVYRRAQKCLNAKDYILYKLTGNFVTDYSDASGTNLFDITRKVWADDFLAELGLRKSLLPGLLPSTAVCGHIRADAAREIGLLAGTPVVVGGGDGSCACVGAGALEPGDVYIALGTSAWVSTASDAPVFDADMRTFNFVHLDDHLYTPLGTMQAAGYSYSWHKDLLCGQECQEAAREGTDIFSYLDRGVRHSPPGAGGLLFLPYLLGERSPRWNLAARGAFIGLSAATTKNDLSRAVLEGVAMNLRLIFDALSLRRPPERMTVIGGGAKSHVLLEILSGVFGRPLLIPPHVEASTSIGAAVCAGVGIGAFDDFSAVRKFNGGGERVPPDTAHAEIYRELLAAFDSAYQGLLPVYNRLARL